MEGGNKMKTRLGGERSFRRFALITLGIMTILLRHLQMKTV